MNLKTKNRTALFYASTKTKRMFSIQGFYKTDIQILKRMGYNVVLSNKLSDFFAFKRYDIAFIYFYKFGFFGGLIARLLGKRVYYTGGIDYLNKDFTSGYLFYRQKIFFLLCYLVSNKCILVSDADAKNVNKYYPYLKTKKLPVIYHSVNTSVYSDAERNNADKLVITIAWMMSVENVERKGVDFSIRVFNELIKLDDEYKMVIIGPTGDGTLYLRELIKELGIEDRIIFTGAIEEEKKISYLNKARFYMQLSSYEGFGLAAIEALACGCVVVHTNAGGLSQGVGEYGVIVDRANDNYVDIANRVYSLAVDMNKIIDKQTEGVKHVKKHFDDNVRFESFKVEITE